MTKKKRTHGGSLKKKKPGKGASDESQVRHAGVYRGNDDDARAYAR